MKVKISILFTSLLIFISGFSMKAQTGRFEVHLDTLGGSFALALYIPEDYDSTKSYPVTVGFHGAGMPADNMRDLLYVADSYNGTVIACLDYNNITTGNMFFARVYKSLNYINSNYNLNWKKSVLAGFSAGAYYAFNTALNSYETFNGVIGISPAFNSQSIAASSWANIKNSRMAVITGNKDEFFPGVDSLVTEIKDKGGNLKYIVKDGMGHGDNAYFNSAEFICDYTECYNFIINEVNVINFDVPSGSIIKASPNPAKDRLIIDLPGPLHSNSINNYTLLLYSLAGEKVLETKAMGEQHVVINTSGISPGIYILKAVAEPNIPTQKAPLILKVVITK